MFLLRRIHAYRCRCCLAQRQKSKWENKHVVLITYVGCIHLILLIFGFYLPGPVTKRTWQVSMQHTYLQMHYRLKDTCKNTILYVSLWISVPDLEMNGKCYTIAVTDSRIGYVFAGKRISRRTDRHTCIRTMCHCTQGKYKSKKTPCQIFMMILP